MVSLKLKIDLDGGCKNHLVLGILGKYPQLRRSGLKILPNRETSCIGFQEIDRQSSERKWPEKAKRTKGSLQDLEGHCWSLCVRTKRELCVRIMAMGGTPKWQIRHLCVRIKSFCAYA
ncbi:hypothetical protein PIB30_045607 [Stylosanthes scabra]|uniref:Uncharacterized protein n=1 Tax=Stylosanthes scabra TaxID=79078 RepID=A0ABU6SG88_9FABA|nr:hypothetical protein [Stylosanthes scabra]